MELTAQEYLRHKYNRAKVEGLKAEKDQLSPHDSAFSPYNLPLTDEEFVNQWVEVSGDDVINFLNENFNLETNIFKWKDKPNLKINFASTLGGNLPVIFTSNHYDFLIMEAILNGRRELRKYPATVNAFTISAKSENIYRHRLILLNRAPYSNVSADKLNLTVDQWLEKSHILRLNHEIAHYETLRIFGGMKNHALDEILADAMGQLAAFDHFDIDRQKLFFGLENDHCNGRLTFYCQTVKSEERKIVYKAVNDVLPILADQINKDQTHFNLLCLLACNSILDILNWRS
ncbi:MAG: hypothetical protein IJ728_13790 [Selenomonadaceae bacterium]|nr:hypothetical protein [Selenomonadaceae bacterium]